MLYIPCEWRTPPVYVGCPINSGSILFYDCSHLDRNRVGADQCLAIRTENYRNFSVKFGFYP